MASAGSGAIVMSGYLYAGITVKAVGVGELGTLTWENSTILKKAFVSGNEPGKVCQAWAYLFDVVAETPVILNLGTLVASIQTGDRADTLNDATIAVTGIYIQHKGAVDNTGVVSVEPGLSGFTSLGGKLYPSGVLFGYFGDGAVLDTATDILFAADAGTVPVLLTVVGY